MQDTRREMIFCILLFFLLLVVFLGGYIKDSEPIKNISLIFATAFFWFLWILTMIWNIKHIFTHLFLFGLVFFGVKFFYSSGNLIITPSTVALELIIFLCIASPISFLVRTKRIGNAF
jgi:hypothetical protein